MQKTILIGAATLGLVLGASQLAAAAPAANGVAMKTAIDAAAPVGSIGYYYRRHQYNFRPHYRPRHYNYNY